MVHKVIERIISECYAYKASLFQIASVEKQRLDLSQLHKHSDFFSALDKHTYLLSHCSEIDVIVI
jgi:hypothetical protein